MLGNGWGFSYPRIITRDSARLHRSLERSIPFVLALVLLVAYLPSLGAGFLNYDDPWLIASNRYFKEASLSSLSAMLFDFSHDTRMGLGAEYLPVRDLSHWLEARLFGISAPRMRVVQLVLYIAAALAFRTALLRALSNRWLAESAAWLFALHPVHVESVAWLAGRKDVLALLFVGLALKAHTGTGRRRPFTVAILFALACLSKSMAVGALGIFVAIDLLQRRKLARSVYLGLGLATLLTLTAHLYVGRIVGMTTAPAGGTRFTAWLTMGAIWLDYLGLCVWPPALSVCHDALLRTSLDAASIAGWSLLGAWGTLGVWRWRRGAPLLLALWLVFVTPLAPVSQVLFPLENLMADRYLFLSVLSPCLLLGVGAAKLGRAGRIPVVFAALALLVATGLRAALFASSIALFTDATHKTRHNSIAPYQLGKALEDSGRDGPALDAYRTALAREGTSEAKRRATNNAARLLARDERLSEAEQVLLRGRQLWPRDPKILANLARVAARQGRWEEACALAGELRQRFADYQLKAAWAEQCAGP